MSATMTETDEIAAIGIVAGEIWHYLCENGPVTMTTLAKEIDAPRDAVMQGVGWLAREGKIVFQNGGRSKRIGLA